MAQSPSTALAALCSRTLDGLKAENIVALDLRGVDSSPADFFVICSATSDVHARALNDALTRATVSVGERRPRSEGRDVGDWVLLDYFDVVVHIFRTEAREYYKLDKLWGDAPVVDFATLEAEELADKKAAAKKTSPKAASKDKSVKETTVKEKAVKEKTEKKPVKEKAEKTVKEKKTQEKADKKPTKEKAEKTVKEKPVKAASKTETTVTPKKTAASKTSASKTTKKSNTK